MRQKSIESGFFFSLCVTTNTPTRRGRQRVVIDSNHVPRTVSSPPACREISGIYSCRAQAHHCCECIPRRRRRWRWRQENQLNNKSISLVRRYRITRHQPNKVAQDTFTAITTNERVNALVCTRRCAAACSQSIWNNFLRFVRISGASSSTLSSQRNSHRKQQMQINSFRQKRNNNNSGIKLVNRYIGVTFSLFYADRTSAINGVDSPHTLEETLRGWKTMQSKAFENTFFSTHA